MYELHTWAMNFGLNTKNQYAQVKNSGYKEFITCLLQRTHLTKKCYIT